MMKQKVEGKIEFDDGNVTAVLEVVASEKGVSKSKAGEARSRVKARGKRMTHVGQSETPVTSTNPSLLNDVIQAETGA